MHRILLIGLMLLLLADLFWAQQSVDIEFEHTDRTVFGTLELPYPILTAQLMLWYSEPIDVEFRADEKHFDVVAESRGVQYELVKKRVDKAMIRGTLDRLTISGHVAIVYTNSNDSEAL